MSLKTQDPNPDDKGLKIHDARPVWRPRESGRFEILSEIMPQLTEHELLRGVAQASPIPFYVVDEAGLVLLWNCAAEELFGWSEAEVLGQYLPMVGPEAREEYDLLRGQAMRGAGFRSVDAIRKRRDGTEIEVALSTVPLRDGKGRVIAVLGVAQDISMEKKAARELRYLARHDELTGLRNRRFFLEALAEALGRDDNVILVFFDIDDFKDINDSFGHPTGDALLKYFGLRLQSIVKDHNFVARLGGDEFALVLRDTRDDDALDFLDQVYEKLKEPFVVNGNSFRAVPSAGVAVGDRGITPSELLKRADLALYEAKRRSRGSYQIFNRAFEDVAIARLRLCEELIHAPLRGELVLHFQPIFSIKSMELVGAEALVRWNHPRLGLLSPESFIHLAEETGSINAIGSWVLVNACGQLAQWSRYGCIGQRLRMSVNLSQVQLGDMDFAAKLHFILSSSGVNGERLELELTESAIGVDMQETNLALHSLCSTGVTLAMDDFGTGHSSLVALRRFPFSTLKIDRSFVSGLPHDSDNAAIVRATLTLAQSLGLKTVAEGVEAAEELEFLALYGCDEVQGFVISRPLQSKEFAQRFLGKLAPARSGGN